MLGSDSREYEIQIIDAVKSVNRALGGSTSVSPASRSRVGRSDFNQYEVQLIDAIKSIGRTISGGIGGGRGGYAECYIGTTKAQAAPGSQALTGITTLQTSGLATIGGGIKLPGTKKIWFSDDHYLEYVRVNSPEEGEEDEDEPIYALHTNVGFYSDSFGSFGGLNSSSGGGGGDVDISRVWESLTNYSTDGLTPFGPDNTFHINPAHIPTISVSGDATAVVTSSYTGGTHQGSTTITLTIAKGTMAQLEDGYDQVCRLWSPYVISQFIAQKLANATTFRGGFDADTGEIDGTSDTLTSIAEKAGWLYVATSAGTFAGTELEVGDSIIFKADCAAGTAPTSSDVVFVEGTVSVENKNATLALDTTITLATVEGVNLTAKLPNLYVARTSVSAAAGDANLIGVTGFTPAASWSSSDASRVYWDASAGGSGVGAWRIAGNLVVDGWTSVGGVNSGSGSSGVDLPRVWQSLTNRDSPVSPTDTTPIAPAHIPIDNSTITVVDGVLTSNGGVTSVAGLSGAVTESQLAGALGIGSIANGDAHLVKGGTVYSYFITDSKIKTSLLPDLYIGYTKVHYGGANKTLYGVDGLSSLSAAPQSGTDSALLHWEANGGGTGVPAWVFNGNVIINGWASVGGVESGNADPVATMWGTLTANTGTYADNEIHYGHIPIDNSTITTNSGGSIILSQTLQAKISASIIGGAYGTGAIAPTKIVVVVGDYPPSLDSDAIYMKVQASS